MSVFSLGFFVMRDRFDRSDNLNKIIKNHGNRAYTQGEVEIRHSQLQPTGKHVVTAFHHRKTPPKHGSQKDTDDNINEQRYPLLPVAGQPIDNCSDREMGSFVYRPGSSQKDRPDIQEPG